ncbi:hypothetical protein SSP24_77520 [Streptomyces spinoverrucosus]|uniref:Uncharacterized protein n=1 Tax=Streptomyces spinoverrucosus TaxID=284043 RepID=A0A4Y3VTC9_9ACTN|nr:hypothetical protein SSP24_77520 [Streptomyces spinoverrucosus]GHB69216.1 hypothetical protein GCM10010397_44530 [Streptomyces spinoverrucosus]
MVLVRHRLGAESADRAIHEHEPHHVPLRARHVTPSTPYGTSSSPSPSLSSSPAQRADQKTEKTTDPKPSPKKADKHGGKGKH